MVAEIRKRRKAGNRKHLLYLILPLLYLVSQTLGGELGVLSYFKLKQNLQDSYNQLQVLDIKKIKLSRNASLLGDTKGSCDLLEEKIKENLGLVSKGELMFKPHMEE